MAVLHRKEEKIQAVLGRLPKKYSADEFVQMFIKLYSKEWGKIKSAYLKQSQDKEPGTVVNMPKPDDYLKQILANYLQKQAAEAKVPAEEIIEPEAASVKKLKAPVKKKVAATAISETESSKTKTPAVKKTKAKSETESEVKKEKVPAKKKVTEKDPEDKPKTVKKKSTEKK